MNIFILDDDIETNAQYHCDKHVVKMILEYAQLASTAHHMTGSEGPYRLTHKNHPCAIWARETIENYRYVVNLGLELCKEYTFRYNKIHKTESILKWLRDNEPKIASDRQTPFALAMPSCYKGASAVDAYRAYYIGDKQKILSWKNRKPPSWIA